MHLLALFLIGYFTYLGRGSAMQVAKILTGYYVAHFGLIPYDR